MSVAAVRPRVLIAAAEPLTRWALDRAFASDGFETCAVAVSVGLLDHLMSHQHAVVVSTSRFDQDDVMPILRGIARARPEMRVIVLGAPEDAQASASCAPNLVIVEQPFAVADLLRLAGEAGR